MKATTEPGVTVHTYIVCVTIHMPDVEDTAVTLEMAVTLQDTYTCLGVNQT